MNSCHVFYLSGDRKWVSVFCCICLVSSGLFAVNDETNVQDVLLLGFRWPDSLVDACHVFHFSSDPQLVWMIRRVFGSLRRVLTEAQLRSLSSLGQDSGQRLRH